MKIPTILLLLCLSTTAPAQDCKNFLFLQNNKNIEMTIYSRKGDPNGKQVYKVSEVKNSGGSYTATVKTEMFDKKGKSAATSTGTYRCNGGVMMVDMKMNLAPTQQEQFKNAEAKTDDFYIEYPASMKAGDALKDGTLTMELDNNGLKQQLTLLVNNRKVEGKESVTTTAGTWDCYKISYSSKLTIKTMGVGIPINFQGTEWFAPNFGIIKTESKMGGTAITAIN